MGNSATGMQRENPFRFTDGSSAGRYLETGDNSGARQQSSLTILLALFFNQLYQYCLNFERFDGCVREGGNLAISKNM